MKIAFHFDKPLPVRTYGGIERIVFWHMTELVKQGHEVVLIGHPDSSVQEYGIEFIPYVGTGFEWEELIPKDVDLAHLSFNRQVNSGLPTICTVHGNAQLGEVLMENSVFVSKRHAEVHGSTAFVHNALDFSEYPFDENKKINWDNFLFLAKASWRVKNLRHCVRACRRVRKHLDIIGGKNLIPWPKIKSHGILGGEEKLSIMNKCDALLFPVRWEEPFGIAIVEAMALGLPVIGSKYGSLPELITPEVGILCDNFEDLVEALSRPPSKDFEPKKIRKYAEENFSISSHTSSYIELYNKVLGGEKIQDFCPKLCSHKRAETLLSF